MTEKKTKTAKILFEEEILKVFEETRKSALNYKQVAKRIGKSGDALLRDVLKSLITLKERGDLIEATPGKYVASPELIRKFQNIPNHVIGKIDLSARGIGFVKCAEFDEDVKIEQKNVNHALDGDTVKIFVYSRKAKSQLEGEVIEIIKRGKSKYVGVIQIAGRTCFMVPDNTSLGTDIYIPIENLNSAKHGEKVVVEITEWPEYAESPYGKVVQVLGKPGEHHVEMNAIIQDYDLPTEFPSNVLAAAKKIKDGVTPAEVAKRRDFRGITTITIDPADAKDFDDALSIKPLPNGNWEIGVHIADVSHYIKPGSVLDVEALERATSIYLVDRVIPMLPERLSNELCSLRPDEDKLTFSAVFELDKEAKIQSEWYGRTVIRSIRRYAYEEVQEIIETGEGDYKDEIMVLHALALKLRSERFKVGALDFEKEEVKFNLDPEGKPLGVFFKVMKDSNKLIEDFMLLANKKVAEYLGLSTKEDPSKAVIYRVHDAPSEEKLVDFSRFVSKLGYQLKFGSKTSVIKSMNQLLTDIEGKGEQNMISTLAIRTMAKAVYTTNNFGHYGLSFNYYTHFTSPIRRYPDVLIHRLLDIKLKKDKWPDAESLENMAKHSTDMEIRASEAERASIKYKQVEFLMDKVGQVFDGVISGVTKWGVYVELVENKCEGMIKLRDMTDDFYEFDEENYKIVGQRHGKEIRLGDKLEIRVSKADLMRKQLDFVLADAPEMPIGGFRGGRDRDRKGDRNSSNSKKGSSHRGGGGKSSKSRKPDTKKSAANTKNTKKSKTKKKR